MNKVTFDMSKATDSSFSPENHAKYVAEQIVKFAMLSKSCMDALRNNQADINQVDLISMMFEYDRMLEMAMQQMRDIAHGRSFPF